MPAAAVIPAPVAYIKVVAVKKLVVRTRVRGRVRGPGAAAPSSVVDFGRPCAFPALSAGVNRLYIRHAVLPAKLRGGVVGVFFRRVCRGGAGGPASVAVVGGAGFPFRLARAVKRRCDSRGVSSLSAAASGVCSSSASPSSPKRAVASRRSVSRSTSRGSVLPCRCARWPPLPSPSSNLPSVALLYLPPRLSSRLFCARARSAVSPPRVLLTECPRRPVRSL